MPYRTAAQRAERDELVAGILAGMPGGITGFELDRRIRASLGLPCGVRTGGNTGGEALRRLEAAGRARFVEEPYPCPAGVRRVWYPVEEGS